LIGAGQRGPRLKAVSDHQQMVSAQIYFAHVASTFYISGNAALYLTERLSDGITSSRSRWIQIRDVCGTIFYSRDAFAARLFTRL